MLVFNKKFYYDWRQRVLADQAKNIDIHRKNGLLGLVLNGVPNYCYSANEGDHHEATDRLRRVKSALKKLDELNVLESLILEV
jgi:hypothetical protein